MYISSFEYLRKMYEHLRATQGNARGTMNYVRIDF